MNEMVKPRSRTGRHRGTFNIRGGGIRALSNASIQAADERDFSFEKQWTIIFVRGHTRIGDKSDLFDNVPASNRQRGQFISDRPGLDRHPKPHKTSETARISAMVIGREERIHWAASRTAGSSLNQIRLDRRWTYSAALISLAI